MNQILQNPFGTQKNKKNQQSMAKDYRKSIKKGTGPTSGPTSSNRKRVRRKMDKRQYIRFVHQQDKLLYVSFFLLLNLSEDEMIEYKLSAKRILEYLIHILERALPVGRNCHNDKRNRLHILAVTFLKALSIRKENTGGMVCVLCVCVIVCVCCV